MKTHPVPQSLNKKEEAGLTHLFDSLLGFLLGHPKKTLFFLMLSASLYKFYNLPDSTKLIYLPSHVLSLRLPWTQRKIVSLFAQAEQQKQGHNTNGAIATYREIQNIEPWNEPCRRKIALLTLNR